MRAGPLAKLQRRVQELGRKINASPMPHFDGEPLDGLNVSLDGSGLFSLTYVEKGWPQTIAAAASADAVAFHIFRIVTEDQAASEIADSEQDTDPLVVSEGSMDVLLAGALSLHRRVSARQELLLGRLDPSWEERQRAANRDRADEITRILHGG